MIARYRHLFVTLAGVYAAMTLLSGLNTNGQPLKPAAWRFEVPRFLLVEQYDRNGAVRWTINAYNQRKILEQAAINVTLGVGMTFVILTGGIDLSVGAMLALCNVVFVRVLLGSADAGGPSDSALLLGIAVAVGVGTVSGILNGWLAVGLRIPSFIVTLGTLLVLRGAAYWVSEGQTYLRACPAGLTIALPIGVSVAAVLAGGLFLSTTARGRLVYAVGGNLTAARYAGVPTARIRVMCFAFSGLCAGLAGVIFWSRTSTGSYTAGEGAELYAIAAVVLGGTRLAGGEGTIIGTFIGALIMAVLANGLNTASVHELTQKIIVGCVLIAAAYIDSRRNRGGSSLVV
ncbi:MAG: ABC transporter permease [Phycisphaerae bacterium]